MELLRMGDEETVSRRELFSGWARGLRDGLAEWVLPELEREVERIRDTFEGPEARGAAGVEAVPPWRDLLAPRQEEEEQDAPGPEGAAPADVPGRQTSST